MTEKFIPPPEFTMVPNEILDEVMPDASSSELKVTLAIARRTFGWQCNERLFTNGQLCEITGLSRQSVTDGLRAAESRGYIGKRHVGGNQWHYGLRVKKGDTAKKLGSLDSGQQMPETRKPTKQEKENPTGSKETRGAGAPVSGKKPNKAAPRDTFKSNPEDPVDAVIVEVFEHWAKGTGDEKARLTQHRASKIRARLREKGKAHEGGKEVALAEARREILFAIDGMIHSDWHKAQGQQDFLLMFREEERIDFFAKRRRAQVDQEQAKPSGNGGFADYKQVVERG